MAWLVQPGGVTNPLLSNLHHILLHRNKGLISYKAFLRETNGEAKLVIARCVCFSASFLREILRTPGSPRTETDLTVVGYLWEDLNE